MASSPDWYPGIDTVFKCPAPGNAGNASRLALYLGTGAQTRQLGWLVGGKTDINRQGVAFVEDRQRISVESCHALASSTTAFVVKIKRHR